MTPPSPYRRNRLLLPCGTEAAYARHRRAREKPCQACIEGASLARALRREATRRAVAR